MNTLLHSISNRKVSYNDTRGKYALVNVPHAMWQPINLAKKTHKALIVCYQSDNDIYCGVYLFPVLCPINWAGDKATVLYSYEVSVSLTGRNAFVKIHPSIVEVMHIGKSTHSIDWTCSQSRNVSGRIYRMSQHTEI